MEILKKIQFEVYPWLDFEYLIDSDGYKFEIYSNAESGLSDGIPSMTYLFDSLFGRYIDDFRIGQFGHKAKWGDFCLDTWDVQNDRYDYSSEGKSKSTLNYLAMLKESDVDPEYDGFCKCVLWDEFLPIVLDCVLNQTAPYSVMIYAPNYEFVFYFHHTQSIGVYYKDLNEAIKHIIAIAKSETHEIKICKR